MIAQGKGLGFKVKVWVLGHKNLRCFVVCTYGRALILEKKIRLPKIWRASPSGGAGSFRDT